MTVLIDPTGSRRSGWMPVLLIVWVASCAYVFHLLNRNWISHDDGLLAQSAERVLRGQMPHRDFADVYTGGLSYLNAAGFGIFGVHLMALRYVLFAFLVAWVPAVFYCASRVVSPIGAAAVTLLSVLWTVPNYPAAMPSWYNLFFATFGAAALLRYSERGGRGWLVAAGVMGGCSVAVKITGCYYVAACLLYFVIHAGPPAPAGDDSAILPGYAWVVGALLLGLLAGVLDVMLGHLTPEHAYHFLVPVIVLSLLALRTVASASGLPFRRRLGRLWGVTWPFLAGLAIPIAAFAAPYVTHNAIGALIRGVFLSPETRLAAAAYSPKPLLGAFPAVLLAILVVYARRLGGGPRGWLAVAPWVIVPVAALAIGGLEYLYGVTWASVAQAIPLAVLGGAAILWLQPRTEDVTRWEQSFLLLAIAGFSSLIGFPAALPVYFCYSAPLALLAIISALRLAGGPPQPLASLLTLYYAAFALLLLNTQSIHELGWTVARPEPLKPLDLPRGRVLVPASDAVEYEAVVATLTAHARGSFTFAGPDLPEIYFLAGLQNPTRSLFDFLEPSATRTERVLGAIDDNHITAVVTNEKVRYSSPLSPELEAGLESRFPVTRTVGRLTVRWRE
jgi:hypothetical protein